MNVILNRTCLELVTADVRGANTDATLAKTRFIIQWIYMPMVVLFGVIANLLNIVVLTRKDMFSSTNYYLAVLACCDILFLSGGMLCTMPKLLPKLILFHPFMFLTPYFQVMTTYVSNLSVAIICCFTAERFIVIRWPMRGRVWFTRERTKRIVLIAVVFTFLIEIPNLIFYAPVLQEVRGGATPRAAAAAANRSTATSSAELLLCSFADATKNATATLCGSASVSTSSTVTGTGGSLRSTSASANGTTYSQQCRYWKKMPTQLALQAEALILAASWTAAVLFAFLPLILLSVLNGYLIRSVLIAKTERCQMTNSYATASLVVPTQHCLLLDPSCKTSITTHQAKTKRENHNERKVTIMLIAVVLLFLACHLPNAFGLLYTTALDREYMGAIPKDLNNRRLIMNNIFNALTQLNAAANFILYSLLSKKFNHTMRRLLAATMKVLCRRRKSRNGGDLSRSISSVNMVTTGTERQSFQSSPAFPAVPLKNGANRAAQALRSTDQIPLRFFDSNSQLPVETIKGSLADQRQSAKTKD